ncbi:MAG: hypothetical protein MJA83_12955 [Gammaproteobacteria bacterium]|nr:hypothetical protein [Gammaproteobacteria bacterium]
MARANVGGPLAVGNSLSTSDSDKSSTAWLAYYGVTGTEPESPILIASPVHLQVGVDNLILFGPDLLKLTDLESKAVCESFNEAFCPSGYELVCADSQNWFLKYQISLDAVTTPLTEVQSRNISAFLPEGPDGLTLSALMNEIQMFFHAYDINNNRRQKGEPELSSLWLWGNEQPPTGMYCADAESVYADDPVFVGLARSNNNYSGPAPADFDAWSAQAGDEAEMIVLNASCRAWERCDLEAWREAAVSFERDWAMPALTAIRKNHLEKLVLHTGGKNLHTFQRHHLMRFWKLAAPIKVSIT